MSTLKTNKVESTTPGGDCIVKATNNLSNRNLVINGAMNVAQRGTTSTSSGLKTIDRMTWGLSGHSVTVTQSQHALTSSDSGPWEKGFRKSAHIALSAAGTMAANTTMSMFYKVEAQDIANSGWDYTSASSYITLSFWFKASTAQTFYLLLFTSDGTAKSIVKAFTPGNTNWNKFTFKIPGASGVQFDNDNGTGLDIGIVATYGTDKTGSGNNLDAWGNYNSSERVPDMASTWLTAGASEFEFTGLQLEVGDVATDFEHKSFSDEISRCERYYQNSFDYGSVPGTSTDFNDCIIVTSWEDGNAPGPRFRVEMRGAPTFTIRPRSSTSTGEVNNSDVIRTGSTPQVSTKGASYVGVTSGQAGHFTAYTWEANAEL